MGGLFSKMPVTGVTWLVGAGALAGLPPLAGFFSKDEILHDVIGAGPLWAAILFGASLMTAFYVARTTRLAFFDSYRGAGHPHEGGWSMRCRSSCSHRWRRLSVSPERGLPRPSGHTTDTRRGVALGSTVLAR
jgi:NADH:ubiquinone oxidoreductase subunit 5 (subunit L)/multisubunit Na+/H+ antiporter MnhA subunit